jgi:hypothetical protein
MKSLHKKSISLIMTAVYLLITLSPLVSTGNQSKSFFQSITKECSGDCRICGCSAERSASHACCCWQKRLAMAKVHQQNRALCQTASTGAAAKTGGRCCKKSAQHHDHEDEASISAQSDNTSDLDSKTDSISTCPCGSGKDLTLFGAEKTQHIPFRFLSGVPIQLATKFSFLQPERPATRYGEPPDQPPKICIFS